MNNRYSKNIKVCATCNFWQGQRKFTSSLRNLVEVVPDTYGDCLEGSVKKTHKMNNAMCTNWQKWSAIRDNNNSQSNGSKKKGIIPYPIFVGLILLVALINFIIENKETFIIIGIILLFIGLLSFFYYRKFKNHEQEKLVSEDNQINTVEIQNNDQQ